MGSPGEFRARKRAPDSPASGPGAGLDCVPLLRGSLPVPASSSSSIAGSSRNTLIALREQNAGSSSSALGSTARLVTVQLISGGEPIQISELVAPAAPFICGSGQMTVPARIPAFFEFYKYSD